MSDDTPATRTDPALGTEGDSDQLQADDTLVDRGVDDVLDEGYAPPERAPLTYAHPERLEEDGESLDQRLADEEPETWDTDPLDRPDTTRSGRLVADADALDGRVNDTYADDAGIDGAAASAEEAAVHIVEEP